MKILFGALLLLNYLPAFGEVLTGQVVSVLVTIIWSGAVAFIAIKVADVLCGGIRSSEDDETEGLDVTDHGEGGYSL